MLTIEVRTSGIWQLSSVVLSDGGEVLVVDPGYFPRELDELRQIAADRGRTRGVVFTHGHWDHVIGWRKFPEATVHASPTLAEAVAGGTELAVQNLDRARMFDGQWYVERELAWPPRIDAVAEGRVLGVGRETVRALLLPGHSPDGLALVAGGVLMAGDYLSPCEIPFVDDLHAYRATLRRLIEMTGELAGVIPGHGPRLSPDEAREIARADLGYLDALALAAERGGSIADVAMVRAADVPGMKEHHRENWDAALRACPK